MTTRRTSEAVPPDSTSCRGIGPCYGPIPNPKHGRGVNATLGQGAVLLGFLAALMGAGTLVAGLAGRRHHLLRAGRVYVWLLLAAALLAAVAMERALVTHDFSLRYVARNNSRSTPLLFSITGMWSALEGSILLWSLVLAG